MKTAPLSRRDRLRMLADLHMPGALEALDASTRYRLLIIVSRIAFALT